MSQPVLEEQTNSEYSVQHSGKKYISPETAQMLIADIAHFRDRIADAEDKLELSEHESSELE